MSFSALRDIFAGCVGADYCVRSVLFLKSPNNVKEYLIGAHKVAFQRGDSGKSKRWQAYPRIAGALNVRPIKNRDLTNREFMKNHANKLSFDISRFIEFLTGYTKIDDDIKPIMLHYGMIYLFDFFSRTWLKYERNWGHGIKLMSSPKGHFVRIQKNGIFPRAVDAFYFLGQPSLFSPNKDDGIGYTYDPRKVYGDRLEGEGLTISERIGKMKYSERPNINLTHLIDVYERLGKIVGSVLDSNPILVGYVILFIMSSLSRYNAKD